LGQKEAALEQFQSILRDFPGSAITEQTVTALAQTALQSERVRRPGGAGRLSQYQRQARAALLRAQAREKISAAKAEKPAAAAVDYLDLYYRFPLNDEAKGGAENSGAAIRARRIFSRHCRCKRKWRGPSRSTLPNAGAKRARNTRACFRSCRVWIIERADLRIVQCESNRRQARPAGRGFGRRSRTRRGAHFLHRASPSRTQARIANARLMSINSSSAFRKVPGRRSAVRAGNYYWVNLDRARAADFTAVRSIFLGREKRANRRCGAWPGRLSGSQAGSGRYAGSLRPPVSHCRATCRTRCTGWAAPTSAPEIRARAEFLSRRRQSISADLFWRKGRRTRPPGAGRDWRFTGEAADFLSVIPPAPARCRRSISRWQRKGDGAAGARAGAQRHRFRCLGGTGISRRVCRTHSPKFLIDAAGAAIAAGHYGAGMAAVRQAFPQLEARRVAEIPNEAWRAAFPLPYESSVRSEAARNQLDPMLVAGLIRQESAFESNALSRAGRWD
jgi:hypothetical protein